MNYCIFLTEDKNASRAISVVLLKTNPPLTTGSDAVADASYESAILRIDYNDE